jgi:hypothetical protein
MGGVVGIDYEMPKQIQLWFEMTCDILDFVTGSE